MEGRKEERRRKKESERGDEGRKRKINSEVRGRAEGGGERDGGVGGVEEGRMVGWEGR